MIHHIFSRDRQDSLVATVSSPFVVALLVAAHHQIPGAFSFAFTRGREKLGSFCSRPDLSIMCPVFSPLFFFSHWNVYVVGERGDYDGVRRLAEAEAEQQRLADAEEYEKAAELSVEIESVKADSEAAARSLRCENIFPGDGLLDP